MTDFDEALAETDENFLRIAELRRQRDESRLQLKHATDELVDLRRVVKLFGRLDEADVEPPKWLSPKRPKTHSATVMLLLSDMHFDEVVRTEEVDGLNAYNRHIATVRLETWAQGVIKLCRDYLSGCTYDGAVVMLGGDTFSGSIHEELTQTNEDTLPGSLLYWSEQLAAAIDLIAEEFGKAHVVAVPGNHGRLTRKPRSKLRSRDNLDWALAQFVARQFKNDRRITFQIPEALDIRFEVYGKGHLLTHGDVVKGGGGIGGIWPPIMRLRAKLADHHNTVGTPFDTLWLGHWHQYKPTPGLVVNGAMKGWDEFSKTMSFPYEAPIQALALATPEHGLTWQAPVFCQDRKREGW